VQQALCSLTLRSFLGDVPRPDFRFGEFSADFDHRLSFAPFSTGSVCYFPSECLRKRCGKTKTKCLMKSCANLCGKPAENLRIRGEEGV
jgi:hypothetical protein